MAAARARSTVKRTATAMKALERTGDEERRARTG
jgi:hypothetical protein